MNEENKETKKFFEVIWRFFLRIDIDSPIYVIGRLISNIFVWVFGLTLLFKFMRLTHDFSIIKTDFPELIFTIFVLVVGYIISNNLEKIELQKNKLNEINKING